jgi:hypothetical protein
MSSAEMNRNDQKQNWLEAVITDDLALTTSQIATALEVTPRTVLGWRIKAENNRMPTGVYEKGWIFPPDHLIDLLLFVAKNIKPHSYKWVKQCQSKHQQHQN